MDTRLDNLSTNDRVLGMNTYTKIFQSILDSTIWQETLATKVVWITLLAMKDRDGYVGAAVPGLAARAGVTLQECETALSKFLSPDPYSRSKQDEGRRIREADGGWVVLNHFKYRDMLNDEQRREYKRVKEAEYRKRRKGWKREAQVEGATEAVRDGLQEANGDTSPIDRI